MPMSRLNRGHPRTVDVKMIEALRSIVLVTVMGIIGIAIFTISVTGGIFGTLDSSFQAADEVISVLGQIGSAGVGALAGYFSARILAPENLTTEGTQMEDKDATPDFSVELHEKPADATHGSNTEHEMDVPSSMTTPAPDEAHYE